MNILSTLTEAITGKPPEATDTLIYEHVTKLHPAAALTKAEHRAFSAAQRKWKHGFDGTCQFTEQSARARFFNQFHNATDHTDPETRTRGLESCVSEYAGKALASKAEMADGSMDAAKVLNAFFPRLAPAAESVLATREAAEKTEADAFGLAFTPTPLTAALRQFLNSIKGRTVIGSTGGKPSDMCHFITPD
jgi:hypothetical protein